MYIYIYITSDVSRFWDMSVTVYQPYPSFPWSAKWGRDVTPRYPWFLVAVQVTAIRTKPEQLQFIPGWWLTYLSTKYESVGNTMPNILYGEIKMFQTTNQIHFVYFVFVCGVLTQLNLYLSNVYFAPDFCFSVRGLLKETLKKPAISRSIPSL